jgi:ribose transport system permease protein
LKKINRISLFNFVSTFTLIFVLAALVVFFTIRSEHFFKPDNFINILRQVSIIGICAVGMTFVILTGGIDLHVGAGVGVSAAIAATLMASGVHPVIATIIPLCFGVVIGSINGFFVNIAGIPPLITTLGTMTVFRGVTMILTDGKGLSIADRSYSVIGQGYLGPIPVPVILMALAFTAGFIVLEKMKFGRYIYGIGDNQEATRLSGVNVKKVKFIAYIFSGFLASAAGIVSVSRLMSAHPVTGQALEMEVITAVVLGGVSITGGEGKIAFVIIGVLIMGVLANGMIMLNVPPFYQWVVRGSVLLLAVTYDKFMQNKRAELAARANVQK